MGQKMRTKLLIAILLYYLMVSFYSFADEGDGNSLMEQKTSSEKANSSEQATSSEKPNSSEQATSNEKVNSSSVTETEANLPYQAPRQQTQIMQLKPQDAETEQQTQQEQKDLQDQQDEQKHQQQYQQQQELN